MQERGCSEFDRLSVAGLPAGSGRDSAAGSTNGGSAQGDRLAFDDLVDLARRMIASGQRRVLGITGAPGSGKSTLCASLLAALQPAAVLVGMDGFHLAGRELERLGRAQRKGAPDTFDVDGYVALLKRLRTGHSTTIYAPQFDRGVEEPIGSATPIDPDTPLIITEGNYLLLPDHGWSAVAELLDEVWYLDVLPGTREQRLVLRRQAFGDSVAAAAAWVGTVDHRNAELIEETRSRADLIVQLVTRLGVTLVGTTGPANRHS